KATRERCPRSGARRMTSRPRQTRCKLKSPSWLRPARRATWMRSGRRLVLWVRAASLATTTTERNDLQAAHDPKNTAPATKGVVLFAGRCGSALSQQLFNEAVQRGHVGLT